MKKLSLYLTSAVMAVCSLMVTTPLLAAWSAPSDLSSASASALGGKVVADDLGRSVAVWSEFDGTHYVVKAALSPRQGVWEEAMTLSLLPAGDCVSPIAAIDGKGNVVVCWIENALTGSSLKVATKNAKGSGWSMPVTVSLPQGTSASFVSSLNIAYGGDGVAWIAWSQRDGKDSAIYLVSQKGRMNAWSAPTLFASSTGGLLRAPEIATSSSGSLCLSWVDEKVGGLFAAHKKTGRPWSAPTQISRSGAIQGLRLAMDDQDNAVAIWSRQVGNNFVIESARNSKLLGWSASEQLSNAVGDALNPAIAMSNRGYLLAAWEASDGAYWRIQAAEKRLDTANWSTPFNVTESGQDASSPKVAVNERQSEVICWKRSNGSNFVIEASTASKRQSWSSPKTLSFPGEDAVDPQVTLDHTGNCQILWKRSNSKFTVIQMASQGL